MNRKMLPLLFMLIAGAITCIATWIRGYSALEKLVILLVVMLIFAVLGSVLQHAIDFFDKQNLKKKLEEEKAEAVGVQDKQNK